MEPAYAPGSTGTEEVLFAVTDGVGHILLNRPKAINSLNTEMCRAVHVQLDAWAGDDAVRAVLLRGAGERGLCAGGDVKAVRAALVDDPKSSLPLEFFRAEYAMNAAIAAFEKPYVAYMDGVTMGGGLGISAHGNHRLVTERSKIAMPETIIGFFPDVGMLHILAAAPAEVGTMLALTGRTIGAGEAIGVGMADLVVDDAVAYACALAAGQAPADQGHGESTLADQAWIADCFAGDSAAEIVARLDAHEAPEAREAADLVRLRSPLAVAVTLRALRNAASMDLTQVLEQDLRLAERFCAEPDFLEGVRCQLVDRGTTPQWRHASLAAVDDAEVDRFFG